MIHEYAVLHIKPNQAQAFEKAFAQAQHIVRQISGFVNLQLLAKHNQPNQYLLHIIWQDINAHQINFRQSPHYQEWKNLLHHFYEPFPVVEYYHVVLSSHTCLDTPHTL